MKLKRRYYVKKPFCIKGVKDFKVGEIIPHNMLRHIPKDIIKNNVFVVKPNHNFSPFGWGLIFQSKEFPHPKGVDEPTREEILCELQQENDCCFVKENENNI